MLAAAGSLLASALALTGTLDFGVRSEVRGLKGTQLLPDQSGALTRRRMTDPVPYELDPSVVAAIDEPQQYALQLGYAGRLLMLARPNTSDVVDTAAYGTFSTLAAWHPSDRLHLGLSGALSRGTLQITPTGQLAAAGAGAAPGAQPGMVAAPDVSVAAQHSESVSATVNGSLTRAISVGGGAAYSTSGATHTSGAQYFPPQESEMVEVHGSLAASPFDALTLRAKYSRTDVYSFGVGDILDVGLRWDGIPAQDVTTFAGAGLATAVHSSLRTAPAPGTAPASTERFAPQAEAGIALRPPLDRPGFGAGLSLAYAPYVDPYTVTVEKRGVATADATWKPLERWRFTAKVAGTALIRDWKPRNGAAAFEVTGWHLALWGDVGLAVRAGYNHVDPIGAIATEGSLPDRVAVPALTYWEWGVSLVGRWGLRTSL